MINTSALKQTLAIKTATIPALASVGAAPSISMQSSSALTVALTITVPLQQAAAYIELLQSSLSSLSTPAPVAETPRTIQTSLAAAPVVKASPVAENIIQANLLSDKQRNMISNLVKRKKMTPERLEKLVQSHFSANDVSQLSKHQASKFIDLLLAQ